jgi:tight adherence protein B
MAEALALLGLASGLSALAYSWRRMRLRDVARDRLQASTRDKEAAAEPVRPRTEVTVFARRHYALPWIVALLVALVLYALVGLDTLFAVTLGLVVGFLGGMLDAMWLARQSARIEQQLADAMDLMVGGLRAGASVPAALESALRESSAPLRPQLEEILGRLRFGDAPLGVFRDLALRVPLENFRLFAATLAVHWEVGGSLAPTLAMVGRTIRDRIEIARRIYSMTTQSRVSIIAILAVTYFIALIMWRNDPPRMAGFLASPIGKSMVAGAVLLQGVGVVWTSRIGRVMS